MHIPVLLNEVIHYLDIKSGGKYIDATYGMGGHSAKIIELDCQVLGIDRDPTLTSVMPDPDRASWHKELDPQAFSGDDKLTLVHGNFANLKTIAEENGFEKVEGILFDLGIGSHQLDEQGRGFAFSKSGPLDMRFNPEDRLTAYRIVNFYPGPDLLKIFREYGEERRFGRRIVQAILEVRKTRAIETTDELFEIIKMALPAKERGRTGDTARRIFQSLRIRVNDELTNIEKALPQALELLTRGGRLVVVSFHSLEDRIVKQFMVRESKDCICPPEFPECRCQARAGLQILTRKPVVASEEETKTNSRAKSAKLRAAEKIK